ncbi:glycosyl transferase family 2 [Anseongella ginsenosidimutans]|uniref:Glycosyl transferase family 2 n=1 Tax=Anseongella ginsenosidimutans TaxID=496056 RepID=A0A4R3KM51_9SPHI|nr:glycosyltransferase [Anseongella ginsenosidimutans]QEC54079.1 glycosyltransferase family 2 protein [Anseongella ginsenosidimutans]TCS85153.1 glycosyl transferase family 2 [Anseongella ginsenosidimutans]
MILTLTYAVFLFLILRFCMVLFNFISNPKLPSAPRNYYDFVSILIPSYVSLSQLAGLLQSIREQDFENYEVLIYGDGSGELRQVAAMAAGRDARVRILEPAGPGSPESAEIPEMPWLNEGAGSAGRAQSERAEKKCRFLASRAKGDYLLFLNRVERVERGLIYNALYRAKIHSLGLLSLFADQKMKTFAEGQLVPSLNYLLVSLLPLRLILLTRWKWLAAGSGQFLLFDARHYQAFQWHSQTGSSGPDASDIMKKMKELGFRVEALFANGYVSGRIYTGKRCFGAFRKDVLSGFEGNIPVMFMYLLLCCLGPLCLMPLLSMQLLGMGLTLVTGMRIMSSLMANQPVWWNLLFHPLQMACLAAAAGASIFRIVRKNN